MNDKPATRRSFLGWLWTGLGLVVLAEIVWVTVAFLRPRRRRADDAAGILVCGPESDFAPGSVTAFPAGKFYLARLADGTIIRRDQGLSPLRWWPDDSSMPGTPPDVEDANAATLFIDDHYRLIRLNPETGARTVLVGKGE